MRFCCSWHSEERRELPLHIVASLTLPHIKLEELLCRNGRPTYGSFWTYFFRNIGILGNVSMTTLTVHPLQMVGLNIGILGNVSMTTLTVHPLQMVGLKRECYRFFDVLWLLDVQHFWHDYCRPSSRVIFDCNMNEPSTYDIFSVALELFSGSSQQAYCDQQHPLLLLVSVQI
jgi:hypothetical protein